MIKMPRANAKLQMCCKMHHNDHRPQGKYKQVQVCRQAALSLTQPAAVCRMRLIIQHSFPFLCHADWRLPLIK